MTRAAAAMLAVYLGVAVVAVAAARDDPPPVSADIHRADAQVTADRELLAENAKLRRQLASTRAIVRTQRKILKRSFAAAPATWLEQAFHCIHRFEGRWRDPRPPYWGGLQMDLDFQQTYGGPFWRYLGTADQWPPSVQIAVAIHAWFTRGFHPWPNTARRCGLL